VKPYAVCSLVLLLALPAGAHAGEPSPGQQARDRVDDLIQILEAPSSSYKVQLLTMAYLGRFHDRRAVPALSRMLDRGRPAVRRLAVTALGQIGAPEAMAVLHGLARSNRHRLGALARRAIQININERLAPPTGPRVRIAAGRFSNHTGQGGRDLGRLLGRSMIASFASHPEVAIAALRDPAGITPASAAAGYVVDGAIVRLDRIRIGDRQRLVCHIRVCVATNPGGSMKAFYRGEATVEASARQPLVELQHEVVQGAAREATRRILHSHLFQQTRPVL